MDMWTEAFDAVNPLDTKSMNLEHKLKIAEIKALLAIAQELSRIRHSGISPEYVSDSES